MACNHDRGRAMQLSRALALLRGQTAVAQKVYAVLPAGASEDFTPADIARELKGTTGAGMDIHTMRGCLARLVDSGLVREVVPGRFRRAEVKEKESMNVQRIATPALSSGLTTANGSAAGFSPGAAANTGRELALKGEPLEIIGGISARLRGEAKALLKIADELDAGAIAMAERAQKLTEEVATVRQIATLLKGLG